MIGTRQRSAVGRVVGLAVLAVVSTGCDLGPAGGPIPVQTDIRLRLLGSAVTEASIQSPTTVLDTVAVVVRPNAATPDTMRATFDENGEASLAVSVFPGTVRFTAFVISNNGTRVFTSDERVLEINDDGFLVELELSPVAPVLRVDPDSMVIDALAPGSFQVANIGIGDMEFTTEVVELVACGSPSCITLSPSFGTVPPGGSVQVSVQAEVPDPGLFTVRVETESGTLPVAVAVLEAPQPIAPDLAGVVNPSSIGLTWSDPNDSEDLLRLERSPDGEHWSEIAILPEGSVGYNDIGVEPASTYHYRLRACTLSICSLYSNIVVLTTPDPGSLSTPTLFAQAVTDTRIDLTWADNSTSETEFQLERSTDEGATWTQIVALAPNSNAFSDRGLSPSSYRYRVRACNTAACSPWSNEAFATLPRDGSGSPNPPSNAKAFLGFSLDFIKLCWDDNSSDETEFQIQRSVDQVTWDLISVVGANTVAFVDRTVKGPEEYFYRVRACTSGGCSAWSNVASEFVP